MLSFALADAIVCSERRINFPVGVSGRRHAKRHDLVGHLVARKVLLGNAGATFIRVDGEAGTFGQMGDDDLAAVGLLAGYASQRFAGVLLQVSSTSAGETLMPDR